MDCENFWLSIWQQMTASAYIVYQEKHRLAAFDCIIHQMLISLQLMGASTLYTIHTKLWSESFTLLYSIDGTDLRTIVLALGCKNLLTAVMWYKWQIVI